MVAMDECLRFLVFFFCGSAFGAFFGFAVLRHFRDGIFATLMVADAFLTDFAGFGLAGGFLAAFTGEGGLSKGQSGNDGHNCDITE